MDKIIERALEHWYAPDHELYGDPLPALMGIVGESGELCDLWKKKLYKPGYEFDRDVFLDELGDCLFYAAVLCHYCKINILDDSVTSMNPVKDTSILDEISIINFQSALLLDRALIEKPTERYNVAMIVKSIRYISQMSAITVIQLSELNHAKLNKRATNGTGYNRGENKHDNLVICNHHSKCGQICKGEHKNPHSAYDDCVPYVCGDFEKVECVPVADDECSDKKDYDTCENEYTCSHDCAVCKGIY